jgi:hypothetical protein
VIDAIPYGPPCPFCAERGLCDHFLGWTEDGKTVLLRKDGCKPAPMREGDRTSNTGVSSRVYRPQPNVAD